MINDETILMAWVTLAASAPPPPRAFQCALPPRPEPPMALDEMLPDFISEDRLESAEQHMAEGTPLRHLVGGGDYKDYTAEEIRIGRAYHTARDEYFKTKEAWDIAALRTTRATWAALYAEETFDLIVSKAGL
jgi:hypothetical protein